MPRARTFDQVKKDAGALSVAEIRRLDSFIHKLLERLEKEQEKKRARREVVKVIEQGSWTYKLESVRCGKEGCKCGDGQLHGPYWYGYRKEGGRTVSKYIGKEFKEQ